MVKIEIDPGAGFCFGVEKAIGMAESRLRKGEEVYTLGEMIHNREEMNRLHSLGMKTVDHRELASLKPDRILLRAHGEPPATYHLAEKLHIKVIDGTCPIVTRLQKRIRRAYRAMDHESEQLVIFGKPDHPETIGHLGQVDGDAVVISSPEEVSGVDPGKKVILFSQTTMDPDRFREVEEHLKQHLEEPVSRELLHGDAGPLLRSECTICGQMRKRKPSLAAFAEKHDVMIFVSGKNSSNGKMLYEFCRSVNPSTHWISGKGEIDPAWLRGASSIGISGATSTSREQLRTVADKLKEITRS
ncbi:MAG: 4-hydroxy-3-methylbut-2-enyl diphosphate reductase [Bacteroidota bacterium]